MSLTITSDLHPSQKAQLHSLLPDFPTADAEFYVLYELDGTIRAAAAFLPEDETCYECYAYTVPEYRNQGLFSALFDAAIDRLPDDVEFVFYTNGKDRDSLAALDALEAELIMEEYMMELNLNSIHAAFPSVHSVISSTETEIDGTRTIVYEAEHGTVKISVFSSYYYLYGLEIEESMRGKGLGKTFLHHVLLDLAHKNPLPLRLQVSGDNLPALSLYKKTGFQITETLFGYLY